MSNKTLITDTKIDNSIETNSKRFVGKNAISMTNIETKSGDSFANLRSNNFKLVDDQSIMKVAEEV